MPLLCINFILTCLLFEVATVVVAFCIPTIRHHSKQQQQLRSPQRSHIKLNGVQEWRAKYSNHNNSTEQQQQQQFPLLLLPFNPTQILLPGQHAKYTFRHGKYMDLIDESITSYESVIGMSILSDDGLLPITVLCEIIEEELDIHMGYRGFSSMEVGIRAVGRVRRCDIVEKEKTVEGMSSSNSNNDDFGRRTTAWDDIHQGKFVDWLDDPLDEEQKLLANEYRENIWSILRLQKQNEEEEQLSALYDATTERLRNHQRHYESACEIIALDHNDGSGNNNDDAEGYTAISWGAFAAATAVGHASSSGNSGSIKIVALSTTDTVERLRLGLAMLLENQMPLWLDYDDKVDERFSGRGAMEKKSVRGTKGGTSSLQQHQKHDSIDPFQ
jgi:hypothetical protein